MRAVPERGDRFGPLSLSLAIVPEGALALDSDPTPEGEPTRTASAFSTRPRRYRLAAIDGEVSGRAGRPNEASALGAEAALGGQDTQLSQSANDECVTWHSR
jgi:hypothetical protein